MACCRAVAAAGPLRGFSTAGSLNGPPMFRSPPSSGSPSRGGDMAPEHPSMADFNMAPGAASAPGPDAMFGQGAGSQKPLDGNDPSAHWERVKQAAQESASQRQQKVEADKPAPPIINVPTLCSRCVGRGDDIFHLWQRLHQGRRILVLRGVDGIGKSTLAAAFGEHARSSGRFTCVQWVDGRVPAASQLQQLLREVQGRKEVRVLLVFDDVANPEGVLSLIPPNDAFCALITTNNMRSFATTPGVRRDDVDAASVKADGKEDDGVPPAAFLAQSLYVYDLGTPRPDDAAELVAQAVIGGSNASAISITSTPMEERELAPDEPPAALHAPMASSSSSADPQQAELHQRRVGAMPEYVMEHVNENEGPEEVMSRLARVVADRVGCVPVLCHLAGCLMHQLGYTPEEMVRQLNDRVPLGGGGEMSVAQTVATLVDVALEGLSQSVTLAEGEGKSVETMLTGLALLNTEDVNPGLVSSLYGEDGARLLQAVVAFGLASSHWSSDAVCMQPLVARDLLRRCRSSPLFEAQTREVSSKLLGMWPRRWRGMGADRAWSLARHTAALHDALVPVEGEDPLLPLTVEMMAAFDRSATFLAHISGRDVERAAVLWYTIHCSYAKNVVADSEAARVALDLARLWYRTGHFRTVEVAKAAHELCCSAHGARSLEAALALVYRVRYLPFTKDVLLQLQTAGDVLDAALVGTGTDEALSTEMQAMVREGLFVLRMGTAQCIEALDGTVPDAVWAQLTALEKQLRETAAAKAAEEARQRAKQQKGGGNAFDLDRN